MHEEMRKIKVKNHESNPLLLATKTRSVYLKKTSIVSENFRFTRRKIKSKRYILTFLAKARTITAAVKNSFILSN